MHNFRYLGMVLSEKGRSEEADRASIKGALLSLIYEKELPENLKQRCMKQ